MTDDKPILYYKNKKLGLEYHKLQTIYGSEEKVELEHG